MVCRVTSTDRAHRFRLISDYVTDPARDSVVIHTTLVPMSGDARSVRNLKVYVRYDATIDNTGGGGKANGGPNNATVDPATTALVSSDTKAPKGPFSATVVGALLANHPFLAESSGFVGSSSDGLSQLDAHHRLVNDYRSATDGNVVQTARVDMTPGRPFTLALGFAPDARGAIAAAQASAAQPFARTLERYIAGWRSYDASLRRPPRRLAGLTQGQDAAMHRTYWVSANVIKAAEDKTHVGAFVASPTDPWGQSVPAATTHAGWTYREVFARDSYETFTGLLADGDTASARDMTLFLFDHAQQPDGSFPRDSELNGAVAPDTFGLSEIDEVAYPLLMAWQAGLAGKASFYRDHIRPAADYIVDHGPITGAERWEEHPGFSPATIAVGDSGTGGGRQAGHRRRRHRARRSLFRHRRRLPAQRQAMDGHHDRARRAAVLHPRVCRTATPTQRGPTTSATAAASHVDQRSIIDAGFLELTRMGELSARRSRRPGVAARRRLRAGEPDRVWPRLAPLRDQGRRRHRRLRRLLRAGSDQLLTRPASRGSRTRSAPVTCGRC